MAKTAEQQAEQKGPSAVVRYWASEIKAARKREKSYRTEGERIREIYCAKKKNAVPFNILYSNTETLTPALYSSTPKPVVQRRFKDPDPLARHAAMAGQRGLEFLIDTNIEGYEPFDRSMRDSVLDALLPGRGVARVKYEAEIVPVPQEGVDKNGKPLPPIEQKGFETVCTELCGWNRVYYGFAKKWAKVPWIAFEHYLDKDEALKLFGKPVADKMTFSESDDQDRGEDGEGRKKQEGDYGSERKTCLVYEIWKKKGKKVCFFSETYHEGYLKEEDDPLELTGFYPLPRPIQFLSKTDDLMPTALYALYENQAKELNHITTRINRIVEAIKVRGAYDGSLGSALQDLLEADDNTLTPTDNASQIALQGGLDKYIWFMPLDMLITVLKQLIVARNECKQVIYEITGIADILRGNTDANETLGAQQIKNQWASMRIKQMQNEVRRYVREMLRMMLEVAAKKFDPETWARMTGLPFTTQAAKAQAQALLAVVPPPVEGQPVDPAVAQAQQVMQQPDWESVLELLQDDISRAYRIDIETNSTIEVNEQEDKQNVAEAMAAMGQFIEAVGPLVEKGIMPFEAAQSMLLSIVRKFRFGTEVEEQIKAMQPPQPQANPDEQAAKIKAAGEAQKQQGEMALAKQKGELEAQAMQRQAEYDAAQHAMRMQELEAEKQANAAKRQYEALILRLKIAQAERKAAAEEKAAKQPAKAEA